MAKRKPTEMTADEYQERMTEAQMTDTIVEKVRSLGGRCWHVRDSRKSPETEDMPDLVIVIPGLVALIELKSAKRQVTPGQQHVMDIAHCISPSQDNLIDGLATIVRVKPRPDEMAFDHFLALLDGDT